MNDIQELRELLKTATPKYQMRLISMRGEAILQMGDDPLANGRSIQLAEKDVMLIAAAVNSLPSFLDEVEALRKSNTECIEEINEMSHNCNEFKGEIEALRKAWTEAESDNNNLRAEIENTRAEPVRKMKLPERHWHHDVGHFYDSEEVIDALTAANVEIES